MQRCQLYIEGKYVDPASGKWFDSFNPYTGEPWAQTAQGSAEDVDRAVRVAHKAFSEGPWSRLNASEPWERAQLGIAAVAAHCR